VTLNSKNTSALKYFIFAKLTSSYNYALVFKEIKWIEILFSILEACPSENQYCQCRTIRSVHCWSITKFILGNSFYTFAFYCSAVNATLSSTLPVSSATARNAVESPIAQLFWEKVPKRQPLENSLTYIRSNFGTSFNHGQIVITSHNYHQDTPCYRSYSTQFQPLSMGCVDRGHSQLPTVNPYIYVQIFAALVKAVASSLHTDRGHKLDNTGQGILLFQVWIDLVMIQWSTVITASDWDFTQQLCYHLISNVETLNFYHPW